MLKDFTALFLKHTSPSRRHLTPELVLRLITPDCPLWSAPVEESPFVDPFWGFYWPGGQATTRYILDNPAVVSGLNVLDVGCGCGAGAVAASRLGAKRAVANDIDYNAIIAAKINADLNNVHIETDANNYIGADCGDFHTIIVGDMFYDEEFAKILFQWLERLTKDDKMVLIGDPGRHGLTEDRRSRMRRLAQYKLPPDIQKENHGFTETAVWTLNKM